jgi:hypothetical protein
MEKNKKNIQVLWIRKYFRRTRIYNHELRIRWPINYGSGKILILPEHFFGQTKKFSQTGGITLKMIK